MDVFWVHFISSTHVWRVPHVLILIDSGTQVWRVHEEFHIYVFLLLFISSSWI